MIDEKFPPPSQVLAQFSDDNREGTNGHSVRINPCNDNGGAADGRTETASSRLDGVVLSLARLIGRQIAREEFERLRAANDNTHTVDSLPKLGSDKHQIRSQEEIEP
jgi:hypothetical protein